MTARYFNWMKRVLVLACAVSAALAWGFDISDPGLLAQMDDLQRQRDAVQAEHNLRDLACYRKFLVNSCRADVMLSRRTALNSIKKQELEISQQQRVLLVQEVVRADQLRREAAAEQELERLARLEDRAQREHDRTQRLQDRVELEQEALERAAAQAEKERALVEKRAEHAAIAADAAASVSQEEKARALQEKRAAHAAVAESSSGTSGPDAKQRVLDQKRAEHAAVAASASEASQPQVRQRALEEKRASHTAIVIASPLKPASKPAPSSTEPSTVLQKEAAYARKQKELEERIAERERRLREQKGSQSAPLPASP